ncbi:MAG: flagellar motor protein PomA [Gammaproteobacteria bacterium]|nr:flagellar motor protein PomA [Gammaproteobacteria bacterium]
MDLATLLGLIGAFGIVILAMMLGGSVLVFINIPSLLVVIVGSVFAVLMKYSVSQFVGAIGVAAKAFKFKTDASEELIVEVVELADIARKGGLLSLEGKEVSNEFMQKGIQLLIDGHDPEIARDMMMKDMSRAKARHAQGASIFTALGDVAPAMGMIGTLVGLVQMLSAMDDPKSIGPAMAVALLTTLYGAMIANMFALPVAGKLELRANEESQSKLLIIDALVAIQGGQNPKVIQQMLQTYIPETKRPKDDE